MTARGAKKISAIILNKLLNFIPQENNKWARQQTLCNTKE